jgi:polyisoprenoid-binding protein YceI
MASRRVFLIVILIVGLGILGWAVSSLGWLNPTGVREVVAPTGALTIAPTIAATTAPVTTASPTVTATTVAAPSAAPSATTSVTQTQADAVAVQPVRFQIDPAGSAARFIVDEVLFGNPNTVIGSTSDVTGTLEINLVNPAQTVISPIQINAATLATDNRFRNRSISRFILQSNRPEYQTITFTPTAVSGLPSAAQAGDVLALEVAGDLQIRAAVQPVTFAVTVTATSASRLTGVAVATVQRADFGLTIPEVDGVADVTEAVRLELEFVAAALE